MLATDLSDADLKTDLPTIIRRWDLDHLSVIEHPDAFGHTQANIEWGRSR
jgi:hypothetical protein